MSLSLAIDFDSTLVDPGPPIRLRPGAAQGLTAFKRAGHRLILHSCRCNPMDPSPSPAAEISHFYETGEVSLRISEQWARFEEMKAFLLAEGLWDLFDEVWQAPGKPLCDRFIDDKLEPPEWAQLAMEYGVRPGRA